jgi:hypothetical protein
MTQRERLPNRRACETFTFTWRGMSFTATISSHARRKPNDQ